MRLFLLSVVVMIAFASNSLLTRAAIGGEEIDALTFTWIRVASGAVALAAIVLIRDRRMNLFGPYRITGVLSLTIYLLGFSLAYVSLDAGVGALILFGVVQVTMFGAGLFGKEQIPLLRWCGAALAFGGLAWLLWPSSGAHGSLLHAGLMVVAGIGWGAYSLVGRKSGEPLAATASNFILAAPFCLLLLALMPVAPDAEPTTPLGLTLAILCGVVTSAMGYALWYAVLPRLAASVAAVAQLTVPVIALIGGVVVLGEAASVKILLASAIVLTGVAISALAPQRTNGSSGS